MSWTRPCLLALLLVCLSRRALPAQQGPAGTVFIVGGVGGCDPLQWKAPSALPKAGVPHRIVVFEWTHGKHRMLRDLQDTPYLLQRADVLAGLICRTREQDPEAPIYLVGHSAGAALVLATAERLPPGSLERIILLSAAVSPNFNLCPALQSVRREIVSFNSGCDWVLLGVGTTLFGTVDRVFTPGAGKDGFVRPTGLDEQECHLYKRLVQVPWRFDLLHDSCGGGHNSPCMGGFLARKVAPWLMP